jgi:putative SOS response-associated peptidase YedK
MLEQERKEYCRLHGVELDSAEYLQLFNNRLADPSIKICKAMELDFLVPENDQELGIKADMDAYNARQRAKWETELFGQRKRLADAERSLMVKETKKALENRRIANNKIEWYRGKLADLGRTELKPADNRIFPFWYAPVVVMEAGKLVMKPMRYHCRPNGKPESYDRRFDGLYNARRDNLEGFWRALFGRQHGVLVASSFYENVPRHRFEHRELRPGEAESNIVLHFNPQAGKPMLLACLWDRWQSPGKSDLLSFTAITDEPPPEVAAAGHDRCVIPLRQENLRAWLNPAGKGLDSMYALLDDRERPYYEHRMAA